MKKIAIFASGSGTNTERIIEYFSNNSSEISIVFSNNKNAYVLERAIKHNIETMVFNRNDFHNTNKVLDKLTESGIDLIVLAGFLWLIPKNILNVFSKRIINIHPALLPKYGGKGMYGMNVHKSVIDNNEKESGITIHYVNEVYDDGEIIFQAKCKLDKNESPESVATKIHELEYKHFPVIINEVCLAIH